MKQWLIVGLGLGLLMGVLNSCGEGVDSDNRVNEADATPADSSTDETPGLFSSDDGDDTATTSVTADSDSEEGFETVSVVCDAQQTAGGNEGVIKLVEMGQTSGTFSLSYQTYSQEDQVVVSYNGTELFDSGCLGTVNVRNQNISFSGSSSVVKIKVIPNCFGGTGTAWYFTPSCPN